MVGKAKNFNIANVNSELKSISLKTAINLQIDDNHKDKLNLEIF